MKKSILLLVLLVTSLFTMAQNKTLYAFSAKTITGETFDFSSLKGKRVMIVNTASKCGYTPQYEQLQELFETYGDDKFTIIGFPSNNFFHQEPGTNLEISQFCTKNYGVTFTMMEKIAVKGKKIHPLYKWLTKKSENGVLNAPVKWNFQKFLIDENGNVVGYAKTKEKPNSKRLVKWIETGILEE
ncbi:MAG: glutathione peroxidase [Bacteroidaceae bacterium]|nr:glutathione peroxidase [Bacteroidaceae bacterium]